MRFTLRDLFWLFLVVALAMSHVTVLLKRPEHLICPCCQSMYEVDMWQRVIVEEGP
jgi:hypothetical protein